MAINLVSLVSQFLTPQLVGSLARAVGVNEAVAQKLVSAAVPVDSRLSGHDGGRARRGAETGRRGFELRP